MVRVMIQLIEILVAYNHLGTTTNEEHDCYQKEEVRLDQSRI